MSSLIDSAGFTADSGRAIDSDVAAIVVSATGTPDDMHARLKSLLPARWFADVAPNRDAVTGAISGTLAWAYSFLAYVKAQTRLSTASDVWLDLAAYDYFGLRIKRKIGEKDAAFSRRIIREILRPRVTRAAISQALSDLTGSAPTIWEPWNPGDCGGYGFAMGYAGGKAEQAVTGLNAPLGGYGVGKFGLLVPTGPYGFYAGMGCYGSLALPNQIFVNVRRGVGIVANAQDLGGYGVGPFAYAGGTPDGVLSGYGSPLGGYGAGAVSYFAPHQILSIGAGFYGTLDTGASVTASEINDCVASSIAAGTVAWLTINA